MIAEIVSESNKPMREELKKMNERMDNMESRQDKMDKKLTEIQMTLENETNKEILILAKGHLNLSRKLDDALRVKNEREMLLIRVTRLENEVRRIKQHIEEIA